jgi:sugar O-acyltransferase (sialic acid O-acetyltransferase NeuD family)
MVVYGGGGHGKAVIELIRALNTYEVAGILDDGIEAETEIMGIPVFGGEEVLPIVLDRGIRLAVNAVGGIGDIKIRSIVFKKLLENGFECPTVVHPKAFVESSSVISSGVQIFPHAYIGSEVKVNFGVIINTGAIVSHDCELEDHVNISPGAILAGMVHIEKSVLIGMGVTVNLGVKIGEGTRIGNGATIKGDVPPKSIIRAGTVWPD